MSRWVLLLIAAALLVSNEVGAEQIEGIDGNKRINQVQFIGTTNSFRVQPTNQMKYALVDIIEDDFGPKEDELREFFTYSHESLTQQLEMGIRYFELRAYFDPKGGHYANPQLLNISQSRNIEIDLGESYDKEAMNEPGFKVFNIPDYDFLSSCYLLKECLREIYQWSANQKSDHLPIIITIEAMSYSQLFEQQNLTLPPEEGRYINILTELEKEVAEVMEDKYYTHNDYGEQAKGWPTVSDVKNRFMFFYRKQSNPFAYVYYQGIEQEKNQSVFYNVISPSEAGVLERDIGIFYMDNPFSGQFQSLVKGGYLLATRAESTHGTGVSEYFRDASFATGAQFITTKYPKKPDYGDSPDGYYVAFEDDALVRQNTVEPLVGINPAQDIHNLQQQDQEKEVKINQIQYIGTHNSYRIQPTPDSWRVITEFANLNGNLGSREYRYTHKALSLQLDMGIRQLEIDVYADPQGGQYAQPLIFNASEEVKYLYDLRLDDYLYDPAGLMKEKGFKVLHVLDYDQNTHCYLLKDCLEELKAWSDANPNHSFIFVMLQIEQVSQIVFENSPFNGTVPVPWTAELLTELDEQIRGIFGEEKLITPDDIKQGYDSVNDAIQNLNSDAWPSVQSSIGKFMFGMIKYEDVYDMFLEDEKHPNLTNRVIFPSAHPHEWDQDPSNIAWILYDEPKGYDGSNTTTIEELVQLGYIVRTRADEPGEEGIIGDVSRREDAFQSGAQFISTDCPGSPYYQIRFSDYYVAFNNGALMQPNPLNCEDCVIKTQPQTFFKQFVHDFEKVKSEGKITLEQVVENIFGSAKCQGFPSSQTGQYFFMIFIGIIFALLQCYCISACSGKQSLKKSDERR
eukprot:TRINITY_DN5334_c0_g1_i1.p1 TRINITY_DN5334_c0_g1~~TRINITY_DN5334_c0_g1_i1.p1  ORF type:complete len:861 (+),score=78.05 TRINITY_DN5334_c0_g1_i1:30-2585(+)